jgi:hypothetical protein
MSTPQKPSIGFEQVLILTQLLLQKGKNNKGNSFPQEFSRFKGYRRIEGMGSGHEMRLGELR